MSEATVTTETSQNNTDGVEKVSGSEEQATTETEQGQETQETSASWLDSLSEDLRDNEDLKGFESLDDAAKALLEQKKAMADAPKPPESPDGYEFTIPDGVDVDEDALGAFKKAAHELGLTAEQADKIVQLDLDRATQYAEAMKQAQEQAYDKADAELKKEWRGTAYKENMAAAKQAIDNFFGDETKKLLKDKGLDSNPVFVKSMFDLSKAISEDVSVKGGKVTKRGIERGPDGRPVLQFNSMK